MAETHGMNEPRVPGPSLNLATAGAVDRETGVGQDAMLVHHRVAAACGRASRWQDKLMITIAA